MYDGSIVTFTIITRLKNVGIGNIVCISVRPSVCLSVHRSVPVSVLSLTAYRSLRTLLLEGNCLTILPYELGILRHLNGLNLSNNPIESPPKHIVQKGTKEVLQYLRDLLKRQEKDTGSQHTISSTPGPLISSLTEERDSIFTAG